MATYHVSSGGTEKSIIYENETMTAIDGGVQVVLDLQASPRQIIYLDFDGELTKYRNADLDLEIDGVQVKDSMLTPDRIAGIIAKLNTDFSVYNVLFTMERPKDTAYSTILVGKTSAFDQYGSFAGLAETVDLGNKIKNDNAFVLLNASNTDSDIVSTIAHEAGHLLGTLDHGGDGLARYMVTAEEFFAKHLNITYNGETSTRSRPYNVYIRELPSNFRYMREFENWYEYAGIINTTISSGPLRVYSNGSAGNLVIKGEGSCVVYNNGVANDITLKEGGCMSITSFGVANNAMVSSGGELDVDNGGLAYDIKECGGCVFAWESRATFSPNAFSGVKLTSNYNSATVHSGTTAVSTMLKNNANLFVYSGGIVVSTTIGNANLNIPFGGIANQTTVDSGGHLVIESEGTATIASVNSGGTMSIRSGAIVEHVVENGGCVNADIIEEETFAPNTITNLMLCEAAATVHSGTIASNTTIGSGGVLYVFSSGLAKDIVTKTGGFLYAFSGGKLTGQMFFENGVYVHAASGSIVDFDISELNPDAAARINNLSLFAYGEPTYTLTVSDAQTKGIYTLAENVPPYYNATITVFNTSGVQLGAISLGVCADINGTNYTLNLQDGDLSVNIGSEYGLVEVYDDDVLTSSGWTLSGVVLDNDGDNLMLIKSGGTATDTTAGANTQINVSSGGVFKAGTMYGGSMNLKGKLRNQLILDGGLSIFQTATTENAEIVLQVRPDTALTGTVGITGLDYLAGSDLNLTIEVDPELTYGTYHLATEAANFNRSITVKKDGNEYVYAWNDDKKLYIPDKYNDLLSLVKEDNKLDLVYQSFTITNFEELRIAVSADWQQFDTQVKLNGFQDQWGKQTNHRGYYSISVTDLAFSAKGTENHIDLTCNGHFNGRIGILTVDADLSENLTVNGEKAGLYLSVNKNEQSGEWEWGDWDLVGKFTVTLQRVDHRFKFHLSETVFDPMNIKGTAEIDTKNGVYTIQGDWQASKHKGLNHATVVATLKDCSTPSDPEKGLELSSFSITLSDAYNRQAFNAGFNLYLVDGRCYNLASCDTEPAGFEGKIGFTWNSYTHRIDKEWQRKLLSAVGIKKDDYYPTNYLTVSAIDTLLEAKMNSDGDFSAKGEVRFLNVLSKSQNADTLSVAWITGEVSYFASNESLAVKGNVGLAGIAEMSGFVWSINNRLQISAQGTFRIPGWMEFLTGYSTLSGYLELVSTDQATCIAVWGEATKENGQISYMGYRYNLTNGDIADISNAKDVESVYQNFTDVLAKDTTGTKRFDKDFMEQYERLQSLIFNGGYSCASESLQVCVTNETTGMQFEFRLADYAENAGNGNGGNASGSGSDSETVQIKVESFNTGGFSIRLDGNKDHLSGDWRVDIRDEGADLEGLELSLQCVESPNCQLKDYSVTGISSNSVAIDYSVSGGDDDVVVSVNCIKHDEEGPQVVCVGILGIEENQAAIDTSVAAASGFYEFYLHVTGNFIPFDSEINAVFSIADRTESDGAIVEDMAALRATEYWMVVSSSQDSGSYAIASSAGGFDKSITIMTDSGSTIGAISVGETKCFDNMQYSLNMTDDTLLFEVVSSVVPVPERTFFTGDFDGDLFDTLAVQFGSSVTVYMNGEPWGLGVTLEDGWTIAGVGDFNGDGLDDFLRVNDEGYVVGEMSNGNGTFSPQVLNFKGAGWDTLGTGDFDADGSDDVLIANPTAASETVGLLGYWESGVMWTLINGYSAEWEMVSTGDFNGDGQCDMLWRNNFEGDGGLTYNAYCTWIVDDPVDWRMVSVANPAEWDFLCSGDFDGDKMNDIAMINNEGVVGIWGVEDGYLSSWSILSAVDTSEWTLAGVGDFNADGTDDIAWCSATTGLVGCWQIKNKELASWQTLASLG